MTIATTEDKRLTQFAERVYEEQKEDFVRDLAERIKNSIDIGMTQVENGECMSVEDSKKRIDNKYFKKFIDEEI